MYFWHQSVKGQIFLWSSLKLAPHFLQVPCQFQPNTGNLWSAERDSEKSFISLILMKVLSPALQMHFGILGWWDKDAPALILSWREGQGTQVLKSHIERCHCWSTALPLSLKPDAPSLCRARGNKSHPQWQRELRAVSPYEPWGNPDKNQIQAN